MQELSRMQRRSNAALAWLLNPPLSGPSATALLRVMAGGVFVSEGVLKFLYATLGTIRFAKLGFPAPAFTSSFVGTFEIAAGLLLIVGLLTRPVAIAFAIEMVVAILSTKISLYLGTSPLPAPPVAPVSGLAAVLHESRSDWAQLLTVAFLVAAGPGAWSLDAWGRARRRTMLRAGQGVSADVSAPNLVR
jgi:putative oxidoreductase